MAELFQFDEQLVGGTSIGGDAYHAAFLVGKFGPLVEDEYSADFVASDKEELLIPVSRQFSEALV